MVGAVIHQKSKVLLLKRNADDFMGGLVELPSGTVDGDEDLIAALVREVKEETGLGVINVEKFLSSFDYISGSGRKTRQLNFLVSVNDDDIVLNPGEHIGYYHLDPRDESFNSLNISDETKQVIVKSFDSAN